LIYVAVTEDTDGGIDTILVARALQSGATLTDFTSYALGANIENGTITSQGAFDLIGNGLNNQLTGNGSDNVLTGGAGLDCLGGRGGQDTLRGGAGKDTYILGSTSTLFRYDRVIEASGEGTDTVFVSKGRSSLKGYFTSYTLGANIENGQVVDTGVFGLRGNALANRLTGDLGANHLRGEGGADTLVGGAGSDVLEGGLSFDVLSGGTGADIFRWRSIADMGTSAASTDRVVSFSRSQGDQLHLASIDAGAGRAIKPSCFAVRRSSQPQARSGCSRAEAIP
jgi:Ca2+-binding RTX toxin-like protein